MSSGFAGYKSDDDFRKAVEREMKAMEMQTAEGARDSSQTRPKGKALKGKPGSKERLAHVAKVARNAGVDQAMVNAMGHDVAANKLLKIVRKLQRGEGGFEAVQEAVDLTVELDRAEVAQLIWQTLPEDGTDDAYESILYAAIVERNEQAERDAEAAAKKRLSAREEMLQQEYDIAAATSPQALDAVDEMAHGIGAETLYNENVDPDEARATLRAGGMLAESQRATLAHLNTHQAINEEIKRIAAPGSNWNDDERAKWEAELDGGAEEAAMRHLLLPDEIAEIAVESVSGPSGPSFTQQLKEETDKLSKSPEHLERQSKQHAEERRREEREWQALRGRD